jgi:hypothetical protein
MARGDRGMGADAALPIPNSSDRSKEATEFTDALT